jgi:hypothetical protein
LILIALFDLGIDATEQQESEEQTKKELSQAKQDIEKTERLSCKKREKKGPADKIVYLRSTRMALPLDLPRQEVVIHPTQDLTNYVQVGEEVTEVLEITPPAFWVKRKYLGKHMYSFRGLQVSQEIR